MAQARPSADPPVDVTMNWAQGWGPVNPSDLVIQSVVQYGVWSWEPSPIEGPYAEAAAATSEVLAAEANDPESKGKLFNQYLEANERHYWNGRRTADDPMGGEAVYDEPPWKIWS